MSEVLLDLPKASTVVDASKWDDPNFDILKQIEETGAQRVIAPMDRFRYILTNKSINKGQYLKNPADYRELSHAEDGMGGKPIAQKIMVINSIPKITWVQSDPAVRKAEANGRESVHQGIPNDVAICMSNKSYGVLCRQLEEADKPPVQKLLLRLAKDGCEIITVNLASGDVPIVRDLQAKQSEFLDKHGRSFTRILLNMTNWDRLMKNPYVKHTERVLNAHSEQFRIWDTVPDQMVAKPLSIACILYAAPHEWRWHVVQDKTREGAPIIPDDTIILCTEAAYAEICDRKAAGQVAA